MDGILKKGHHIYLEGELDYQEYTRDGMKIIKTEIVLPHYGGDYINYTVDMIANHVTEITKVSDRTTSTYDVDFDS